MTDAEFSEALGRALGVCRYAAGLKLPIEEMIEFVEEARMEVLPFGSMMLGPDSEVREAVELEALLVILAAVGEVAAIGAKLPAEPPAPPPGSYPIPANVLRGA